MKFLRNFIVSKRVGFYVGVLSSLLALIFVFIFAGAYGSSIYMDPAIIYLPILAIIAFLGLSFYRPLEGVGPILLAFAFMGSFAIFAYKTYGYLSEVFFAGFNEEAWAAMKPEYMACFIFALLAVITSIVSVFTKKSVDLNNNEDVEERNAKKHNKEVKASLGRVEKLYKSGVLTKEEYEISKARCK